MQRQTRVQAANRAACTSCHQRKVRCDAHDVGVPCSNCRSAARLDCRIHQKRKRASKVIRAVQVAPPPVTASSPITPRVTASTHDPETVPSSTPASLSPPSPLYESPDSRHHQQSHQCVHSTPASAGVAGVDIHAAEDGEYLYKRHLVEFIDQPELVERPIDSKARMTYIGSDLSNIHFLVRHQFQPSAPINDVCHYPTNRISRRRSSQADRIPLDAFQLPPRAVVDDLLEAYFRRINPGFPVIDEHLFVRQYRARDPSDPPSLLLLQAILVAGAHVLHRADPERRDRCKSTFFRRAKSLLDAGFERNRDTVVQAALLLTWHTDGVEDVTANAWFWLGVAVRTALGLGMHRDADGSTLVPHNKRMWRRVWWLLFQCDVWVSLQYGRPQSIHLEDCSVQPLRDSDFADCGDDLRPDYVLQMSLLAVVVSESMRARSRASTSEDRLVALERTDEKLANWALRLPSQLHLYTAAALGLDDIWRTNLHLHYNMALVLLHRSQPRHATGRPDVVPAGRDEHSEICVAAAAVIQSLFQNICETGNLQCLWISAINCLFTALIQLSTEIRLPNPLLAISALRKYDSALLSLKKLADHWPNAQSVLHFFEKSVRMNAAEEEAKQMPKPRVPQTIQVDMQGLQQSETPRNVFTHGDDVRLEARSDEMLDAWKQWQSQHWHSPGFSDEFLFTF